MLNFQVVVITGASSGIGEALAHAFYEQGSKVILASRRETELSRVKNDLTSKNLVSIQSKEFSRYEFFDNVLLVKL